MSEASQADPTAMSPAAAATVTVYPDGPLILRGDFEVRELAGAPLPTARVVALCRCGRSAVKPFCDNSHKHIGRRGNESADGSAD